MNILYYDNEGHIYVFRKRLDRLCRCMILQGHRNSLWLHFTILTNLLTILANRVTILMMLVTTKMPVLS